MNVELPTIADLQIAFNSKMNAASFFVDQIKKLYQPETNIKKIPDELYYYVDAVIFELHAASQMLLQIINIKSEINTQSHKVNWSPTFQKKLQENNEKLFNWWSEVNASPDFHILESMRQHISHRGESFLLAEMVNDNIKFLSIPIRFRYYKGYPKLVSSGKSIELLDELVSIGHFLNMKFSELGKF